MSTLLERTCALFSSRILTLQALLDKATADSRSRERDPEALLTERLAPDMLPLAHQIVFVAEQPRQLAAFCLQRDAGPFTDPARVDLQAARGLLEEVRSALQPVAALSDAALTPIKQLALRDGIGLELPGREYLEDFLVPNFYFHLVTAYGILRHVGVPLGKADYMAHLASRVRIAG
jgi:hypothetical protein